MAYFYLKYVNFDSTSFISSVSQLLKCQKVYICHLNLTSLNYYLFMSKKKSKYKIRLTYLFVFLVRFSFFKQLDHRENVPLEEFSVSMNTLSQICFLICLFVICFSAACKCDAISERAL